MTKQEFLEVRKHSEEGFARVAGMLEAVCTQIERLDVQCDEWAEQTRTMLEDWRRETQWIAESLE